MRFLSVLCLVCLISPSTLWAQTCPAGRTALVLSGGGAKGLAHIGVLRALDSLGIRPDLIVGSSMGAIIGGLYASGYSARDIDSLARHLPLTRLFRTYEPRVPFSLGLLQPAIVWEEESGGLAFQRAAVRESEVNALLNAGFLRGNLQARGDFDSLPIPFRAVATDLLTGEPVVFRGGDLAQAVRASAAIPLLFEPERLNGRYLGDGGLSANVPTAIARREGASRLIVSLTNERIPDSLNLQSTFVLIDHLIGNLFRQPGDSLNADDLAIRPDVEGFQSLNFAGEAVNALIARGFDAAFDPLRQTSCLPRPHSISRSELRPVIGAIALDRPADEDAAILPRLLSLEPGRRLDVAALQGRLRALGASDRYASVWLFPTGQRDSVSFRLSPRYQSPRTVAVGAAYDNDLGGQVWVGQVSRHQLGRDIETSQAAFLGELRQELRARARRISVTSPLVSPAVEVSAARELVRRFDDGDELTPLKVHYATGFVGLTLQGGDSWLGSAGLLGRLWDAPGDRGHAALGPRLEIVNAGRLAEPRFRLAVFGNSEYQRFELEGIATIPAGRFRIRPHGRFALGESLPDEERFVFGGDDGFAGRHIGELRNEREVFGSLILLYQLRGQFWLRVEPMAGAVGGNSGWLPDGRAIGGIRVGFNLITGLGPIRAEYGYSDGGRNGLLVRIGRWF